NELGRAKIRGYYVEQEAQVGDILEQQGSSTWYRVLNKVGVHRWGITLLAVALITFRTYFRDMTSLEENLFSVGILMTVLSNYSYFLFAVANRSEVVAGVFILASFILLYKRVVFTNPQRLFKGFQFS